MTVFICKACTDSCVLSMNNLITSDDIELLVGPKKCPFQYSRVKWEVIV